MRRRGGSLQWRLVAGVSAAAGALWLAAALWLGLDTRHEIDELLDAHLAQSAALLIAQHAPAGDADEDDLELDAPILHRYGRHVALQVWQDGRLVMRSSNAPLQPMSALSDGFETRQIGESQWRLFAARHPDGKLQVVVGEETASRADVQQALLRGLLIPLALVLPALALVAWGVVRAGLAPLRRLGTLLASRPAESTAPIELPGGPAPREMAPLLAALDALLSRIAGLLDAERRFTADAAHELRTPIAAIRAQAQVAMAADDPAQRQRALTATLAGCDRASRLVQQMLTLARLETTGLAARQPVDLAHLSREVAADLAPAALARRQVLDLETPPGPCVVDGDADLLAVLLRNLLDNAIRYAPVQARIHLVLSSSATGGASLRIEDGGPGLDEASLARLGERFFRAAGPDAPPGSGLGWSIVRRIAQAHGASVEVGRSPSLGGLAVTLRWP